jgi:large subunit ribosomal protein L5
MYEFLERLITVTLPRVRDFKGISGKAFDGRGNYSLGFRDQVVFPEIDLENVDTVKGMNIAVVTSAKNDEEGRELLSLFGFPFRK